MYSVQGLWTQVRVVPQLAGCMNRPKRLCSVHDCLHHTPCPSPGQAREGLKVSTIICANRVSPPQLTAAAQPLLPTGTGVHASLPLLPVPQCPAQPAPCRIRRATQMPANVAAPSLPPAPDARRTPS